VLVRRPDEIDKRPARVFEGRSDTVATGPVRVEQPIASILPGLDELSLTALLLAALNRTQAPLSKINTLPRDREITNLDCEITGVDPRLKLGKSRSGLVRLVLRIGE
jgi:hypothetical protein